MSWIQIRTSGGGGWTPTPSTVFNGISTNSTGIYLGGELVQTTEITNQVASGINLGFPLRIYTADFSGFGAFIGVIPDPSDPSNPVNLAGMRTYGIDNDYIAFGAQNNGMVLKGEQSSVFDYLATVSGTETAIQSYTQRVDTYSTGGIPYLTNNGYYVNRAADESRFFQEVFSGLEAEYYKSATTHYDRFMGVDAKITEYLPTEGFFITNQSGTRNSSNVAQGWYERGAIGAAWTKRLETATGDNPTNDWGEYYRSQRRISIYDVDADGNPLYVYDSGTQSGVYAIETLQYLATRELWDNVIRVDMGVLINNSEGEFGNTEYIKLLLPACSSQYDFGRELTIDFIPVTDVSNPAYPKRFVIESSDGSTVGGLASYTVPSNQKISITLKGGNNPTQYEIIEGFSNTRFSGRVRTLEENFVSQVGEDVEFIGGTTGNALQYNIAPYTFSVDGDRLYGKFFVDFADTADDKLISFLLGGDITSPQYIGSRAPSGGGKVQAVYEIEIVRTDVNNLYMSIAGTYSNSDGIYQNCSYVRLETAQPTNSYILFGVVSDTINAADIKIKKGSFLNFEPGIIPV